MFYDDGRVTANSATLLRQAPMTAEEYMVNGCRLIDEKFGEGFAKKHPDLLAAFMVTCAIDLGTAAIARALDHLPERLELPDQAPADLTTSIDNISDAITDLVDAIKERSNENKGGTT